MKRECSMQRIGEKCIPSPTITSDFNMVKLRGRNIDMVSKLTVNLTIPQILARSQALTANSVDDSPDPSSHLI